VYLRTYLFKGFVSNRVCICVCKFISRRLYLIESVYLYIHVCDTAEETLVIFAGDFCVCVIYVHACMYLHIAICI